MYFFEKIDRLTAKFGRSEYKIVLRVALKIPLKIEINVHY